MYEAYIAMLWNHQQQRRPLPATAVALCLFVAYCVEDMDASPWACPGCAGIHLRFNEVTAIMGDVSQSTAWNSIRKAVAAGLLSCRAVRRGSDMYYFSLPDTGHAAPPYSEEVPITRCSTAPDRAAASQYRNTYYNVITRLSQTHPLYCDPSPAPVVALCMYVAYRTRVEGKNAVPVSLSLARRVMGVSLSTARRYIPAIVEAGLLSYQVRRGSPGVFSLTEVAMAAGAIDENRAGSEPMAGNIQDPPTTSRQPQRTATPLQTTTETTTAAPAPAASTPPPIDDGRPASTHCDAKGGSPAGDNAGTPAPPDDPDARRAAFIAEVFTHISEENPEDKIQAFCGYWTEPSTKGTGRMRFDEVQYWDTATRLAAWDRRDFRRLRQTSTHIGAAPARGPIIENMAGSGATAGNIRDPLTTSRQPQRPRGRLPRPCRTSPLQATTETTTADPIPAASTPTPNNENGDNRPRRLYVGIDPGKQTGVAVWDVEARRLTYIATMGIIQAQATILNLSRAHNVGIWIEDARMLRKSTAAPARQLGAGSVRRDCGIWEEFCLLHKLPYRRLRPAGGKLSAEEFRTRTGWRGHTNEHGRDAAMLVFNRR